MHQATASPDEVVGCFLLASHLCVLLSESASGCLTPLPDEALGCFWPVAFMQSTPHSQMNIIVSCLTLLRSHSLTLVRLVQHQRQHHLSSFSSFKLSITSLESYACHLLLSIYCCHELPSNISLPVVSFCILSLIIFITSVLLWNGLGWVFIPRNCL